MQKQNDFKEIYFLLAFFDLKTRRKTTSRATRFSKSHENMVGIRRHWRIYFPAAIISTGFCLLQLCLISDKYFKYDVTTEITMSSEKVEKREFAVSLCFFAVSLCFNGFTRNGVTQKSLRQLIDDANKTNRTRYTFSELESRVPSQL